MKRVASVVLLFATVATAQAPLQPNPRQPERRTTIVFEPGGDIIADPLPPMVSHVQTGPRATFPSILRVRENFNDKVLKSVNEL